LALDKVWQSASHPSYYAPVKKPPVLAEQVDRRTSLGTSEDRQLSNPSSSIIQPVA